MKSLCCTSVAGWRFWEMSRELDSFVPEVSCEVFGSIEGNHLVTVNHPRHVFRSAKPPKVSKYDLVPCLGWDRSRIATFVWGFLVPANSPDYDVQFNESMTAIDAAHKGEGDYLFFLCQWHNADSYTGRLNEVWKLKSRTRSANRKKI